ncbi:hypothetical protein BvCmsOUNP003_04370 [Escherichia coli]|nr:hypothetical protein BvCms2805_03913 [Escherichia coli]GCT75447.1 hypothetical protein HmCmsJML003_00217 [Escherichia coli]GDP92876.1 hypothetical protein BvCmsOUNP003_04370 [Escherichia coli]GDT40467.1 hypothetical protein BvCmsSINP040_03125 [Escherichia coli]GDV25976.1 hypothetical protein BvCmsSIP044_03116 [Escherichia coli]
MILKSNLSTTLAVLLIPALRCLVMKYNDIFAASSSLSCSAYSNNSSSFNIFIPYGIQHKKVLGPRPQHQEDHLPPNTLI